MDPSVVSYGCLQNGAAIAEMLADGWKLILVAPRLAARLTHGRGAVIRSRRATISAPIPAPMLVQEIRV